MEHKEEEILCVFTFFFPHSSLGSLRFLSGCVDELAVVRDWTPASLYKDFRHYKWINNRVWVPCKPVNNR